MPVVAIRDPAVWMSSMCRHEYSMNWPHDDARHCPNLVPNQVDIEIDPLLQNKKSIPVHINYSGDVTRRHDSLVHHWNEWYNSYYNALYPRLIVRFEDVVFHPQEVVKRVCECAGGALQNHKFKFVIDSAKHGEAHGAAEEKTGYLRAIIKYGSDQERWKGMTKEDLSFAKTNLDPQLMRTFGYLSPPILESSGQSATE